MASAEFEGDNNSVLSRRIGDIDQRQVVDTPSSDNSNHHPGLESDVPATASSSGIHRDQRSNNAVDRGAPARDTAVTDNESNSNLPRPEKINCNQSISEYSPPEQHQSTRSSTDNTADSKTPSLRILEPQSYLRTQSPTDVLDKADQFTAEDDSPDHQPKPMYLKPSKNGGDGSSGGNDSHGGGMEVGTSGDSGVGGRCVQQSPAGKQGLMGIEVQEEGTVASLKPLPAVFRPTAVNPVHRHMEDLMRVPRLMSDAPPDYRLMAISYRILELEDQQRKEV